MNFSFQRASHLKYLLLWTICCGYIPFAYARADVPQVICLQPEWLAHSRKKIQNGDPDALKRLNDLIKDANKALRKGPYSVVDKTLVPPSGDKHDYMSLGPYWWPDPDSPDGLPYINKDGVVNPESMDQSTDQRRKANMCNSVYALSLAYYFTGEEKYAKHAALLIRTWFIDPETRMNPNLNYGQAIRGRNDGRGIGIIESAAYVKIVDAVGLLKPSNHWKARDEAVMKTWFRSYLKWMLTHPHGIDESDQHNNHGTYYDLQVVCFALFTGHTSVAKKVLNEVGEKRIKTQIRSDGSQPHELKRTKSFHYSCMNLEGFYDLARMGDRVGIDLWKVKVDGKPALRTAFEYLIPYANPENKWPYKEIKGVKPDLLLPFVSQAYIKYRDKRYLEVLKYCGEATLSKDALLFPLP